MWKDENADSGTVQISGVPLLSRSKRFAHYGQQTANAVMAQLFRQLWPMIGFWHIAGTNDFHPILSAAGRKMGVN